MDQHSNMPLPEEGGEKAQNSDTDMTQGAELPYNYLSKLNLLGSIFCVIAFTSQDSCRYIARGFIIAEFNASM